MKVALSAEGLNKIVSSILPSLLGQVRHFPVPGIDLNQHGFGIHLSSIAVDSVSYANFDSSVSASDLDVSVTGVDVQGHLQWRVRQGAWPHVQGSGSADFSITGGNFKVSLHTMTSVSTNGFDLVPVIVLDHDSVSLGHVKIEIHHSIFSWLLDVLANALENQIKGIIGNLLQSTLSSLIKTRLNSLLSEMKFTYNLGNWGFLDYAVTGPSTFDSIKQVVSLGFNGEVYPHNSNVESHLPRASMAFSSALGTREVQVVIDLFTVNSALNALYVGNVFSLAVTDKLLPDTIPFRLNTTYWVELLPILHKLYPNNLMKIVCTLGASPVVRSELDGNAFISGLLNLNFQIFANDVFVDVFQIGATFSGGVKVSFVQPNGTSLVVFTMIPDIAVKLSILSSEIGVFGLSPEVPIFVETILNELLVSKVNEKSALGFPFPSLDGFSVANAVLTIADSMVYIDSDLAFSL